MFTYCNNISNFEITYLHKILLFQDWLLCTTPMWAIESNGRWYVFSLEAIIWGIFWHFSIWFLSLWRRWGLFSSKLLKKIKVFYLFYYIQVDFRCWKSSEAVTNPMRDEGLSLNEQGKGTSKNCVDKIWAFFDHQLPPGWHFWRNFITFT